MSAQRYMIIAALGSAALLLGALAFQHWGGLAPCKLCLWQRWPHGAAIALGLVALVRPARIVAVAGALAAAVSGGIGIYHVGVEQKWWQGPTTCTSGDVSGLSASDLLDQILAAPVIRCDEIAWDLFGVSMAGWNAIICAALIGLWLLGARAKA